MERVPTYKDYLEEIMQEYKGDLIATSACLGGELPKALLEYREERTPENKMKVHNLITWLKNVFGDDLYFELQPSEGEEQKNANEMLLSVGRAYGVPCILSTDAHYLNKDKARAHEVYLQASDGEREVAAFYSTTYVMDYEELTDFFGEALLDEMITNTHEIRSKIEPITFEQEMKVPNAHIPKFTLSNLLVSFYGKYEYIKAFSESTFEVDRYYLQCIIEGLQSKNQDLDEINLSRINLELEEVFHISKAMEQPLSSYFVLTKELVDIMWEVSLVGTARGSASCFYTNYLLDIVQINPIKFDLPHWRFLSKERPELPDVDLDSESSKRSDIIRLTKEAYGSENVLNMGTFTTEGTRSTVMTACRGLYIDKDVSQNIANLVPMQKGGAWPLKEAFFGDKEQNKKPAYEFIIEVEKYPGLKDAMLLIEGLISGRSQHASGLIVFPDGYIKQNAMMKTSGEKKLPVTQFDAVDSAYMGGLKFDFLSINALDRIRAAMDLLLEYGKIEWQGTLKATYNKYFHPDVLEMDDPKMFDMLYNGDVINAFQFETPQGQQTLGKLKARSFDEIAAANTLMRLSCDGEQPLDKFIKHKNNIQAWYSEMFDEGLNGKEVEVLEKHLNATYGIADSQESLMLLIMDKEISGYDLTKANKFRKAIAKQDQEKLQDQQIQFYASGEALGTRKEMLDYVWEKQFKPSFGYAFSKPHVVGYSLILMIEMNICLKYGSIFWKTASLSVNAGLVGEEEKGTDYGAIAKAVGEMKGLIMNPDINLSKMGFTPLEEENEILFGLKPISGVGVSAIEEIIKNRPYTSFEDFYLRIIETGLLSNKKCVSLIKAGCFDSFEKDRRLLMVNFVRMLTPKRDKLTMAQLPVVLGFADKEKLKKEVDLYWFRQLVFGKTKAKINPIMEKYFIENYSEAVEYEFKNGVLEIDKKSFEKVYKKDIEPLREWLISSGVVDEFNKIKMREFWVENCLGTIESWEMETVCFYSSAHELDYMPISNTFPLAKFRNLTPEPFIVKWNSYRGRRIPVFKIDVIAGTVVEKNKAKRLIHVLTQDGVVTIRFSKGQYAYYDKKVVVVDGKNKKVLDASWFDRGTKLVLIGFRRGEEFVLRKTGTTYNHTVMRINGYNAESIQLQVEKVED